MTRRTRGRDGYILVAVLAVAVILTGLLAAGSVLVRSALGTARVEDADVAAGGLLSSGVEIAAYQLAVLRIRPEAVDGRPIRLTGGTVTPHVTDEAGKVDLNAASPEAPRRRDDRRRHGPGDRDRGGRAHRRAAWSARRHDPRGRQPSARDIAASAERRAEPVRHDAVARRARPGGGQASTVDRRASIAACSRWRTWATSRAFGARTCGCCGERLTIYNPDGRLDIMTADPDLLSSIPGMTKLKLEQLLAARDSGSADAAREAQSALGGDLASFTKALPGPAYTVRIDVDEKSGRRKSVEAVIAASKSPNQPYYILDWRE